MVRLKVIDGITREKPNYAAIYANAFTNAIMRLNSDLLITDQDLDSRRKLVFYGVKMIVHAPNVRESEELNNRFNLMSVIKKIAASLTPREFQTVFPIQKIYDGHKYELKDYFFTRKRIEEIGEDNSIGENITKFFWDYQNRDVSKFQVEIMSTMSDIRRVEGHKGLMEEFLEGKGVTTHTLTKDDQGNEFLTNNDTGEFQKVKKRRPKYLKVLK